MKAPGPVLAALLCLPALAVPAPAADGDDAAKKPDPAPAGEAKPEAKKEAKKERKVDPAAEKLFQKYVGLVHYPAGAGVKSLSAKGELEQMGMTIGIAPKWTAEKGFDIDLTLPDPLKEMFAAQGAKPEQAASMVKGQLQMFAGLNAPFEPPAKSRDLFDIAVTQEGEDQVVDMTAFDDKADAKSRRYVFGKDGLLKTSWVEPKPNPQMPPGFKFESTWGFEKKGERHVLVSRDLSFMGQEAGTKFAYYEPVNGVFLLKDLTMSSPMQGEQVIHFHDYTVDGKLVESTKAPEKSEAAPKPEPKPAEKPAEAPPAPKQGDK